jgi:general secretion pathway protein G
MRRRRGFSFVELMVVAAIIVILLTMAIPMYHKQVIRSREAVLKSNLFTLRVSIHQFMFDRQMAPHSLDDLTAGGYLKDIPTDPITGESTTWKTVPEDSTNTMNSDSPGIMDVKSGSTKVALDGTRYSEW